MKVWMGSLRGAKILALGFVLLGQSEAGACPTLADATLRLVVASSDRRPERMTVNPSLAAPVPADPVRRMIQTPIPEEIQAWITSALADHRQQEVAMVYRQFGHEETARRMERALEEELGRMTSADILPRRGQRPYVTHGHSRSTLIQLRDRTWGIFKPEAAAQFDGVAARSTDHGAEIAAYRFDRFLGVNRVPVTIPWVHNGVSGSLQVYVPGTLGHALPRSRPPDVEARLFDYLIGEIDRADLESNRSNWLEANLAGVPHDVLFDHGLAYSTLSLDYRLVQDSIELWRKIVLFQAKQRNLGKEPIESSLSGFLSGLQNAPAQVPDSRTKAIESALNGFFSDLQHAPAEQWGEIFTQWEQRLATHAPDLVRDLRREVVASWSESAIRDSVRLVPNQEALRLVDQVVAREAEVRALHAGLVSSDRVDAIFERARTLGRRVRGQRNPPSWAR